MGKSPGKWIKAILFGKKASRSSLSKGRNDLKASNEKETLVSPKAQNAGLVVSPPSFPQSEPISRHKKEENPGFDQVAASNDGSVFENVADKQGTTADDSERIRQEQAATKAQAAFRGYLARRAFRALMGIIRLQALVRGHLVRRQAVATLHCIRVIVKFQALVRTKKEDAKNPKVHELHTFIRAEKLLTNSLIIKLLDTCPNVKPLCLHYAMEEPNSAWSWLSRWTYLRVWVPLPPSKKIVDSKSHTRAKRGVRKAPPAHNDNSSPRFASTSEKPKRNIRKASGRPVDPVKESSQSEFEKVKSNLRKVTSSANDVAAHNEVKHEKAKRIARKASGSPASDISPKVTSEFSETEKQKQIRRKASGSKSEPIDEVDVEIPRKSLGVLAPSESDNGSSESSGKVKMDTKETAYTESKECTTEPFPENGVVDVLHCDHPASDSLPSETDGKDENTPITTNGKLSPSISRRSSLSAKQDYPETGLQNTPKLPSYMQATESVKAKLRAQGSPRSELDVADQNVLTRRLSLPSSANGKTSSHSPRTQRPQANSKGGMIKQDRSILSSKDGNEKVSPVEWKR